MTGKTIKRYVWLIDTLLKYHSLTFEEIALLWGDSGLDDGKEYALRTFHVHRKAITELFGFEIKCDSKYRYYISTPIQVYCSKVNKWLMQSFTTSNFIEAGRNMVDRIIFDDEPRGTVFLKTVIDAMQHNKVLKVDYQAFNAHHKDFHIHPYAMRLYRQRWYIVGFMVEDNALRVIALDRVIDMEVTEQKFVLPLDFNAKKYFADRVGVYVSDELTPQTIVIRVYGDSVNYLRKLPLHSSQEETLCYHNKYSEFRYRVCLTPELTTNLLSMGENVEVLEPLSLREEIRDKLSNALNRYKK